MKRILKISLLSLMSLLVTSCANTEITPQQSQAITIPLNNDLFDIREIKLISQEEIFKLSPEQQQAILAYLENKIATGMPAHQAVRAYLQNRLSNFTYYGATYTAEKALALNKGNYTKVKPTKTDKISINKGISFFNKLDNLDHVQALIVKEGKIVSKEDNRGTKKMLSKLKKSSGGILIKFPKKKQDLRMDLPTVGLNTFKDCKKFGLKGIILKSKKNIFLDKSKCINFANKNRLFIRVI